MGWWRTFLDSLDSNGGHIVLLFALLLFGAVLLVRGVMEGGMIVGGSFAAVLTILKDRGSNREQSGGSTTVAQVQSTVPTEALPHVEP